MSFSVRRAAWILPRVELLPFSVGEFSCLSKLSIVRSRNEFGTESCLSGVMQTPVIMWLMNGVYPLTGSDDA